MADIFLSYAHEDQQRILPLVDALTNRGWSVFWDREIPAGKTWRSYIGQAITDAKCIIVAWSKDSVASQWVSEEAEEAKKRGVLVPVLLDPVEQPMGFRSIQAADLSRWRPDRPSPKFDRLLRDLEGVLGAPTQSTPVPPPKKPVQRKWRYIAYATIAVVVILGGYLLYSMLAVKKDPGQTKPTIQSFTAQPTTITAGETAKLEWRVADAGLVVIDPSLGAVETGGTKKVTPAETTTYTLIAKNSVGQVRDTVRIRVETAVSNDDNEDCLRFNPGNVRLVADGEGWLLTDGGSRMMRFDGNERGEGNMALRIIRHYGLNQHCFVGRPQASMEYFLVNGAAPSGQMDGEDCIGFNPRGLETRRESNGWLLTDGRSRMIVFPNREEADHALTILRKYAFTKTCYVGRPRPSMTYFRR